MPVTTLDPNTHLKIRYPVPRNGVIEYHVEAERAVNSYVLDSEGVEDYYKGRAFSSYGGLLHRREHHQDNVKLDYPGWWYLIIENDSEEPVAVYYDVKGG